MNYLIQRTLKTIGKMSSKIKFLLFTLLVSNSVLSQKIEYPIVSMIDGDSVVIFKTEQARKLVLINEQKKECFENLDVLKKEIIQKDVIIDSKTKEVNNLNQIVVEKDGVIANTNQLNESCKSEKKQLEKDVKKQKIGKWLSIGGIVIVGILGIIF